MRGSVHQRYEDGIKLQIELFPLFFLLYSLCFSLLMSETMVMTEFAYKLVLRLETFLTWHPRISCKMTLGAKEYNAR